MNLGTRRGDAGRQEQDGALSQPTTQPMNVSVADTKSVPSAIGFLEHNVATSN
jgi:hypothetical protein